MRAADEGALAIGWDVGGWEGKKHGIAAFRDSSVRVLPFDEDSEGASAAIEVYPALIRTGSTGGRPEWFRALAPGWADASGDAADAVVCASLALAWAFPGQWGLPSLKRPSRELPADEGWIFYPAGSEWRGQHD